MGSHGECVMGMHMGGAHESEEARDDEVGTPSLCPRPSL